MITTFEQYVDAVVRASVFKDDEGDSELMRDLLSHCQDVERAQQYEKMNAEIYERPPRTRIVGVVEVFPLGPLAREAILDELCDNWFYDRKAGVVLINMSRGAHEGFATHLYTAYSGKGLWGDNNDNAAAFLKEGMGFYLSSAASWAIMHPDTRLTAQEKTVFKGINFSKLERFR